VTAEWLLQFIRNPHFFQPRTPMPRFGFTEGELRDLVAYLLTEFAGDEEAVPAPAEHVEPGVLERVGREALQRYGCLSCHELKGMASTGKIGPDLSRIGARQTANQIRESILAPDARVAPEFEKFKGIMPKTFGDQLTARQLEAVVQFLAARK